ncbi:MAG: cell division protein FtsL [Rhizobiaceae bacterium]
MIFRTIDIIMVGALMVGVTWTFKVKNESERALARVAELEAQIEAEREAIDLLRADWSLLTSPDRLDKLVERHSEDLKLAPADPTRIMTFDELPMRPPEIAPRTLEEAMMGKPDTNTITGGIDQ